MPNRDPPDRNGSPTSEIWETEGGGGVLCTNTVKANFTSGMDQSKEMKPCTRENGNDSTMDKTDSIPNQTKERMEFSEHIKASVNNNRTDAFFNSDEEGEIDLSQLPPTAYSGIHESHINGRKGICEKWRYDSALDISDESGTSVRLHTNMPNEEELILLSPKHRQRVVRQLSPAALYSGVLSSSSREEEAETLKKHNGSEQNTYHSKPSISDPLTGHLLERPNHQATEMDIHFTARHTDNNIFCQEDLLVSSEASLDTKSASEDGLRSVPITQKTLHFGTDGSHHTSLEHSDNVSDHHEASLGEVQSQRQVTHSREVVHDDKVDIASLPILKNPLQKAGRHTVIRGRLSDDHPFSIGAYNLGFKLASRDNCDRTGTRNEPECRKLFAEDLRMFLKEIGNGPFKVPVIGGGDLDLFLLAREVMLLGGVQNVVRKRAFRIVAQQLGIPKTCTSAASVLKGAYERLLFHYEQRIVFGKWPENPSKAVNMKERVFEEKVKERKTRACMQVRSRSKGCRSIRHHHLSESRINNDLIIFFKGQSEGLSNSDRLARLALEGDPQDPFTLPCWANSIYQEHNFFAIIAETQTMELANIQGSNEAVLVAVAECFDVSGETNNEPTANNTAHDMCLAQTILGFSADAKSVRKTQGFLFNLLAVAVSTGDGVVLASNDSAEGLLEGLLKILEDFLEDSQCCELIASPSNNIDSLPFSPSHDDRTRQTIAQAYCALKVLSELAKNSANKGRMFLRRDVLKLLAQMLRCENLYHAFLTCTLETVWLGSSFLSAKNHGKTLQILTEGLLRILETSTSLNATSTDFENLSKGVSHPAPDFSISGKVLSILSTCSPEWGLPDMLVRRFLKDISRLLFLQHMVDVLESVAEICLNLATGFPKIAGTHEEFIPGVLQLLHSGKCLDLAVETLCHILPAHSLEAYRDEIRRLCERQLLSDTQVHSLSELLEDLISGPGSTRTLVHVSSCAENDDKETFVESNIGNDRKSKNGK